MRLLPVFLLAAVTALMTGCGPDPDEPLDCDRPPEITATNLTFEAVFHPDADWELAADLINPSSAIRKYGWILESDLRVENPNQTGLVVDSLRVRLTIAAPGDTAAKRFQALLGPITVGAKRDTVVSARFLIRLDQLGSELADKFLNKDLLGYEMEHAYAYHLPDIRGCGDLGPNAGADSTDHNSAIEGALVTGSVAAASWTIENYEKIWDVFEVSFAILSALLKVAGH